MNRSSIDVCATGDTGKFNEDDTRSIGESHSGSVVTRMIGGLLVDAMLVAAVVAFAWGGTQLGGITTIGRLVEAIVAGAIAIMLRDPMGSLVSDLIGLGVDSGRIAGMVITAGVTWAAANSVYRWWRRRREDQRALAAVGDIDGNAGVADDPLDSRLVARIAGGLLGLGWGTVFIAMLVLQPSDTVVSRSAVESRAGGVLISTRFVLEWMLDGFPHFTQTLPKGKVGAVVGERDYLPMQPPVESVELPADADQLLRRIGDLRRSVQAPVLTFNPDVAGVARRHATGLADGHALSYRAAGGGVLDQRVMAALGEAASSFEDEVGIEVLWAHDPETAMRGLLANKRAQALLMDDSWSEIGIGVADAGWFNGRIYVLLLVAEIVVDEPPVVMEEDELADSDVDEPVGEFLGSEEPVGLEEPAETEAREEALGSDQ